MTDQQNIVDIVRAMTEFLDRVANEICDCRAPNDKEPLDLECHSADCAYPRIVKGRS